MGQRGSDSDRLAQPTTTSPLQTSAGRGIIHGDARASCFREAQRAAERDSKFLVESKRSRWLPSTRSPPAGWWRSPGGRREPVREGHSRLRASCGRPRSRSPVKSTLNVRIRSRRREIDLTAQHLAPFSRVTRPYRRRAVLVSARPGRHPSGISSFCRFAPMWNLTTISLSSSPLRLVAAVSLSAPPTSTMSSPPSPPLSRYGA